MVLTPFKDLMERGLRAIGLALVRSDTVAPLEVFDDSVNPRALTYLGPGLRFVVNVPMELGRSLPIFPFTSLHPFVRAASAALKFERGRSVRLNVIRQQLADFYETVQPQSALTLTGLQRDSVTPLGSAPPWAVVMPWEKFSLNEWRSAVTASTCKENARAGRPLSISSGWAWCGPVSPSKLEVEARRLLIVLESIERRGYRRSNLSTGDVVGVALATENGHWCWQASTGQHRISVLAALGWNNLPLRLTRVVRREDAELWPNVRSGLYTRPEAEQVFDTVMAGSLPDVTIAWTRRIQ